MMTSQSKRSAGICLNYAIKNAQKLAHVYATNGYPVLVTEPSDLIVSLWPEAGWTLCSLWGNVGAIFFVTFVSKGTCCCSWSGARNTFTSCRPPKSPCCRSLWEGLDSRLTWVLRHFLHPCGRLTRQQLVQVGDVGESIAHGGEGPGMISSARLQCS